MVKFGLNGSDATTAAVRLARAYTGREKVAVCRDQPFFSTDDWFIVTTPMSAGIPEATRRLTVQFSFNDLADLERLFDAHPGEIAAVVMEAETVQPPAAGYFDGLRRLCDRHGALLVLDEMITGFRWHERGAQFVYGIEPDLCTFGKGIANGFPVSGTGRPAGGDAPRRLRRRCRPGVPAVPDRRSAAVGAGGHAGGHRHRPAGADLRAAAPDRRRTAPPRRTGRGRRRA